MAATTISDLETITHRYYRNNKVPVIARPHSPFFMNVRKNPKAVGQYRLANLFSDGGGRSGTFSDAQGGVAAPSTEAFEIGGTNLSDDHAVAQIPNKTLLFSENRGVVANQLIREGNAKLRKLVRSAQIGLYSEDGSRSMGTVASYTPASSDLVLSNPYEARRFQVSDRVVINDGVSSTSSLRSGGAAVTVTGVDPSTSTLTAAAAWDGTIAGITAGDHVFHKGDAADGGSASGLFGLPAWIPLTAPTSTPFFTVDRSVAPESLGGQRVAGTGLGSQRAALMELGSEIFNNTQGDASVTDCYMPVDNWKALNIELDERNDFAERGEDAKFGFRFIKALFGPYMLRCIPDPENNTGNAYMLDMSTWELASLGGVPHLDRKDGNKILRVNDAAAVEMRWEAYAQLGCQMPGHNGVVSLPTP